ncbi:hypothetical protein BCR43DRAFT_492790 [Syncephalastrum racemosum]|uniref:PIN domain-containing protein n=1 Tax=Syncephalastrum racemosum TaxID=13706 RepID=A0A1X2H9H5_SYNRA|nr:hypothetical protein BCR43DRAFT_492790 [Syncephalastrum racemosum]
MSRSRRPPQQNANNTARDEYKRSNVDSRRRQLFNPQSDHPIAFNKDSDPKQPPQRPFAGQRREGVNKKPLEILKKQPSQPRQQQQQQQQVQQQVQQQLQPQKTTTPPPSQASSEKDAHKRKIKALYADLQEIESRIAKINERTALLPFFETDDDHLFSRGQDTHHQPVIQSMTQRDARRAADVWRQKTDLHIALADKYLELICFDYVFSEKKSLESLCWKRAIYSLVEQFRQAFKLRAQVSPEEEEEEEEEEDDDIEVPVISETGMTMMRLSPALTSEEDDQEDEEDETRRISHAEQLLMLKRWFNHFLNKADDFYRRLMLALRALDVGDHDHAAFFQSTEAHLEEWRRTRRLKWYKSIPNRGDLARYRLAYVAGEDGVVSKRHAFGEAWRWYAHGVWLMPATGKLYFHLSLLMTGGNKVMQELQKLYFGVRSLMVRRNGFVNAREGLVILFEANRRWVDTYLEQKKQKHPAPLEESQEAVAGLLVRLHGMIFTKIGLDQYAQIKRRFLSALFPSTPPPRATHTDVLSLLNDNLDNASDGCLSGAQMFWFETAILCIACLYNYDYSTSKFAKLLTLQSKRVFGIALPPDMTATYESLLDETNDSLLFAYGVDLQCQIAIELMRRSLDPGLPGACAPSLPLIPQTPMNLRDNEAFIFSQREPAQADNLVHIREKEADQEEAWMIYIEVLLHWLVLNGICQPDQRGTSLWDRLVSDKVAPVFWDLLYAFLTQLTHSLPDDIKYDIINRYLLDDDEQPIETEGEQVSEAECAYARLMMKVLGRKPVLPEEMHMRGLGWVDDITGKLIKLSTLTGPAEDRELHAATIERKIKVLEYGFALSKQMSHVFYYDPVREAFTPTAATREPKSEETNEVIAAETQEDDDVDALLAPTTLMMAMDDAVLFSNETDAVEDEDDDMLTQLKKRREQLQTMLQSKPPASPRKVPMGRHKERQERLNRLHERVLPGQTTLVLDTNCFIGHFEHVKKLIASHQWQIVIPLVVVTELDGLKSNTPPLGTIAANALVFIEAALKQQRPLVRVQTSHNNFIHDISIRSEQFVFGETDKNLDDLVLSACLWWAAKKQPTSEATAPVCLVTGDRNLSVKARARDIDVVSVSAIMQLKRAR